MQSKFVLDCFITNTIFILFCERSAKFIQLLKFSQLARCWKCEGHFLRERVAKAQTHISLCLSRAAERMSLHIFKLSFFISSHSGILQQKIIVKLNSVTPKRSPPTSAVHKLEGFGSSTTQNAVSLKIRTVVL